ncbi:MAG: alpha/beta hydrolase [Planctomycetaceae bacterium]|nr:MAG: alpha/beta hydrolase [Planctomycetaceae bacterium]
MESILLWPGGAPDAAGNSPEDCPRLTPYLPEGDGPFSAVIVCPGGGYKNRAAHEGEPIARWLNTLGIAGLVLDYRVAPYRHPVPLGDAQRAIRLTRAKCNELRVDPARVGILGFSAGGHLAASAATIFDAGRPDNPDAIERQSCRPDALIACYPVITFGSFRHEGSMHNLLGQPADAALQEHLSLEHRVTPQTPPTFIWHTANDNAVPVENSLLLAIGLARHDVPFALHIFPEGGHGMGLAKSSPTVSAWTSLCSQWLSDIGFGRKK